VTTTGGTNNTSTPPTPAALLYRTQVPVPPPPPGPDWDPDVQWLPFDVITYEWQFAGYPAVEGARRVAMLDRVR
jgi:hypothetical protein